MDFRLDDQQLALQAAVADFCADRYPFDGIGQWETAEIGSKQQAWAALAELGVFSITVPEADGGLGLGLVDAALVFEQLGRRLVPGPLVWTALGSAILGSDGARPGVITGLDRAHPDGAHHDGASLDIDGPVLVEHAGDARTVVVLDRDGVSVVDAAELPAGEALDPLDPLTPVTRYDALPAGRSVGDRAEAERLRAEATVLSAALLVGVAQAALDVARDYSLERHQFDRPIGSFQALKHMMADMYVRTGLARSSTYAAAAVIDDPAVGDLGRAVSGAKLLSGEAAVDNSRAAVQILGGMGFTWEMPANFLLKRAWVLEHSFGTSTAHALSISDALAGAAS